MALIPAFFLDCVVAIGVSPSPDEVAAGATGPGWIATGFFYGRHVGERNGQPQYYVYLVSNRHVFDGLDEVVIRANPAGDDASPARDYPVHLVDGNQRPLWIAHRDQQIDVAVMKVDFNQLRNDGMQVFFFQDDLHALTRQQLVDEELTEGDDVYILGYPMQLVGDHRAVVIVRNGSLARVRDALGQTEASFLVDATVFPGNSGGPVILRPQANALSDTKQTTVSRLVGIVSGYVSYTEAAVSAQTQRVRMIFEENSGLASAHMVDAINDCIEADPRFHQTRQQLLAVPDSPPVE